MANEMESNQAGQDAASEPPAVRVGVIDIGSNMIRAVIAEVTGDGGIDVLEELRRAVRLGQDTFCRGRLSGGAIRATVDIIRDVRRRLTFYGVDRLRAVATSAVREATNGDNLIDRVLMATGVEIDVIDTTEESRLAVGAVHQALGGVLSTRQSRTLIADVGGGSTLLTMLDGGEISASLSLPLGSIRLQENLATKHESPSMAADIMRHQIGAVVAGVGASFPLGKVKGFIAIGGDARFAAKQAGAPTSSADLASVAGKDFDRLVGRCETLDAEGLARRYHLQYASAEKLNPALLIYQALFHATAAKEILVSKVALRDGLLLDMARMVTGDEDPALAHGVVRSAVSIAEKYQVDLPHARSVVDSSLILFDQLRDEHGLSARHRLLLEVAGTLHEVGGFVSNRAHHKHSFYIILHSEIFGLTREEICLVAHVARYHRRSVPKPAHIEYMHLPREQRMIVSKLAAILRVADALDRAHIQQVRDFEIDRDQRHLVLRIPGVEDLTIERRAMAAKADLFQDIYGLTVRLEESRQAQT